MKGRAVPGMPLSYRKRVEAATALYQARADEVHAAVALLPDQVMLKDGRVLAPIEQLPYRRTYRCIDGMTVMASVDATPHGLLRHISVSYAKKDPSWSDLRAVRAAFFSSDVDVIQVLPRADQYVNFHQHCFHLFEAPADWQGGWFV